MKFPRRVVIWWLLPASMTGVVAANAFVPQSYHRQQPLTSTDSGFSSSSAQHHPNYPGALWSTKNDRNDTGNFDEDNYDLSTPKEESVSTNSSQYSSSSSSVSFPRGGSNKIRQDPPPQPSFQDYSKFALPCLGLWVAQPLLSLVDTAFIGLSGNPAQSASNLAALGPATTFFDGATYLFAFLNVATTNLYSTARAKHGEKSDAAESVVQTASRVAWRCGLGLMVFLMAFARPLLAIYIGMLRIDLVWSPAISPTTSSLLSATLFCL